MTPALLTVAAALALAFVAFRVTRTRRSPVAVAVLPEPPVVELASVHTTGAVYLPTPAAAARTAAATASPYGQDSVVHGKIGLLGSTDDDPRWSWHVRSTDDYFDLTSPQQPVAAGAGGVIVLERDLSPMAWSAREE